MRDVYCLIITVVTRALSFLFDYYVSNSRAPFPVIITLVPFTICLCLIITLVTRALSFLFDCYVSDSRSLFSVFVTFSDLRSLFSVWLLRY